MLERARDYVWAQLKAVKPAFVSKKPHFNFISVHYFWIIGATIVGSIAIYASGGGGLAYVDALMFASGANTQAGLNPVDVNKLNGFQQAMIYLFAMLSNPITLHACVVFLRLYWFEKRFQSWVRDIRSRRPTLTKSKSESHAEDVERAVPAQGVNGRNITIMPHNGRAQRITNDGILLEDMGEVSPTSAAVLKSDESDSSTMSDEKQLEAGVVPHPHRGSTQLAPEEPRSGPTAISFANTVKRSDGMGEDALKVPQRLPNAEHIAILERQRNQDNEVLRIPGPRDAERGLGPRRLHMDDPQDDDEHGLPKSRTVDSRIDLAGADPRNIRGRQSTIVIAEPDRHRMDDLADEAKAVGGAMDSLRFRKPPGTRTLSNLRSVLSRDREEDMPYLSYTPTLGRNSNFVGLTLEQREELGGIEYRSLRTLALILLFYFWGFQLIILAFLLPFIFHDAYYGDIVEAAGVSKTWWGFFTSNVAFMDVGFTLTPDSMISFQRSEFALIVMWFFIIIGNTGFPVMLRFLIWVAAKLVPRGSGLWEELRFLLDHPRRCFTLLFPSGPNWWLFWILIVLNALDLLFFIVLDLGSEPISQLPLKNRVVVGFFQAASTRTAGFSAVNMSDLHPAMPVLYMIMMYISVFPIAISIRRTNVYEEKSLGVYQDHNAEEENDASALSYVGSHLRRQLSFDLCAYGTLVIIAMQIRGRHRGLPYGLDRAVLLPSESRFRKEAEEAEAVLARVNTGMSGATTSGLQRQRTNTASRRSMSREGERTNGNLILQFLHPGPPVQRDSAASNQRRISTDSYGLSLGPRMYTEPEAAEAAQSSPEQFHKPWRTETSAF
ncbi:cation transport protein [Hirsutella rhossiliensis]|uniref:Potassium transport protein n=1 Tax=Hirsutella rhossiliensis TaxID=111463 RepID=A0A9P8N6S0_9HYPO|nr:cation transport protein [Hirsutella rhossiliensis]KAH0966824.1 cation transport protein [Hirsutella rhossiliensis]